MIKLHIGGESFIRQKETEVDLFGKVHGEWVRKRPVPFEALHILTLVRPPEAEKGHIFLCGSIYGFLCSFGEFSNCEPLLLVILLTNSN
jgi:hypothetical protein